MSSIEYGLRFAGIVQNLLYWLLSPIWWYLRQTPSKTVPPIQDELLLKSATYLAKHIREGKLKSEDVVRAYIKRAKEVNPIINAIVQDSFSTAIEEAIEVDKIIENKQQTPQEIEKNQPLLGVPITIKETCMVKGMSFTSQSLSRKGVVGERDALAVHLLRKAGAIFIAVTNTPELCLNWETNNLTVGRTLNPYNTNYTSGGSSGGEGALIGSGGSMAGLGSDIAGSIRIPANFNGIFGHKPTARVVSIDGHFPTATDESFPDFLVLGPLTRYAEDLKLMMGVLDHQHLLKLDEEPKISNMNVFFKEFAGDSFVAQPVDDEIRQLIRQAARHLERVGAKVAPADFVDLTYSMEVSCSNFGVIQDLPDLLRYPDNPKEYRNIFLELLKSLFGLSNISFDALCFHLIMYSNFFIPKSSLPKHQKDLAVIKKAFMNALGTNGIFLYPTQPSSAFQHSQSFLRTSGVMYAMMFNTLGFPATHVTMGLNKNGLPIGIQVIAAPHQDHLCFAVAEELEKQFGGWIPPTGVCLKSS